MTGDSLSSLLRERVDQPISLLARWIVRRDVVSFSAHGEIWLPVFQFDLVGSSVKPGVSQTMAELSEVFDDWELAEWFATPNCWLEGEMPAAMVDSDAQAVVQAARTDRFVALG